MQSCTSLFYRILRARSLAATIGASVAVLLGPAGQETAAAHPSHEYHHHDHHFVPEQIDLVVHGRDLHAVGRNQLRRLRLGANERVIWSATVGKLAVALTDDRIIAITTRWPEWQTRAIRVHESKPLHAFSGAGFAVVVTDDRAIAIGEDSGSFVETSFGTHERIIDALAGDRVALVLTDKRMLGYSGRFGDFTEQRVGTHEELVSARAGFDFATVATDRRLLVFDAPSSAWQTRRLGLY